MKKSMLATCCLGVFAAVAAPMMTPWGEMVTAENAWREYPRPQMVRSN